MGAKRWASVSVLAELVGEADEDVEVCVAGRGRKTGNCISDGLVDGVPLC